MNKQGVGSLIDKILGNRPKQATYSYSDIVLFWIYCNLCGAERLEDSKHLKNYLTGTPSLQMPSPDAIGRVFKSLSTKDVSIKTKISKVHKFNNNELLHDLLIGVILKLGVLNTHTSYTLDYDNTVIFNKKYDSRKSYLMEPGYQPGASFIGKVPVHVQGRNGDAAAGTKMIDTVTRAFDLLDAHGVQVNKFRSDSAAFQKNIVEFMDNKGVDFFIRAKSSKKLEIKTAETWKWTEFDHKGYKRYVASFKYAPFGYGQKEYRYVVSRSDDEERSYNYFWIITNNTDMSDEEIFRFYGQRGKIERNFDTMKNDFNWARLPFSFMSENTVFLLLSALAYVVYLYCVTDFSRKVDFVKSNYRLKNFIYFFITVGAEWIKNSELKLYTTNRYEVLLE